VKIGYVVALAAAMPLAADATDGYFANGYGMKSLGMAGAAVAVAQEPFGGAVNPGAMSFLGNEWQAGLSWFSPRRSASRSGSGPAGLDADVDSDSEHFAIPEFGINWKLRPDLALGVTVYGNGGMNTDYPGGQIGNLSACTAFWQNNPVGPYNLLCGQDSLGVDLMQLMIAPYASWQFVPGHSIGIAPLIAYQRFRAEGLQVFDNPVFSTSPGSVTNRGYDDSWGAGVRVGYMGQLSDQIAVGIAYGSKIEMDEFDKYKGLFAQGGGFDIPSSLTVGFAWRPTPQWLVAVDYQKIWYDDAPSVNNPSRRIGLCVPPQMGGAGERDACLGGASGAGFGWQNVDVWKLGVQYAIDERWTVRAGYNRSDNPIRPEDVTFNILAPGVVQDQFHAGATWRIDRESEITGMFMYAAKESVSGTSLFAAFGLPPSTTETIEMREYQVGIAYGRRF
jgi:long-chain fatty acid transport protein